MAINVVEYIREEGGFMEKLKMELRSLWHDFTILPPKRERHISTNDELMEKSWRMTGRLLGEAVEKVRAECIAR